MNNQLVLTIGQHSDKGCKPANQDFHGTYVPREPQLGSKGVAVAVADGISSSDVSHIASQTAVTSFLEDYYCTSDAWSVKTSGERVLVAANAWLYSQTQASQGRYDKDRGYVCTLSALVVKSTTAHLFHVGDTRIYQVHGNTLEQLTTDHRVQVAPGQSYLGRALGIDSHLEIDYRTLQVEQGDCFVLATDGVYEFADAAFIVTVLREHAADLDRAARLIVEEALRRGSQDNLTVQLVRVDALPAPDANEVYRQMAGLPFPPLLESRAAFDGYKIIRELHGSSRSHIYLAVDFASEEVVVIKTPSVDMQGDPAYLERFLMEEWVARRISNAHVLQPCAQVRKRGYLYVVMEYIEGRTLTQWMIDNPKPDLDTVRGIVEQLAKGLRAFHRLEMLHQDLRPDNIMIDATGTVKIIDFGSTKVAGLMEIRTAVERQHMLGTPQFTAPEYFLGDAGSVRSDLYSLGVIAYRMLTGKLPYGIEIARATSRAAQRKLHYDPVRTTARQIPQWVDDAIAKAVHPDPAKRYEDLSEFIYDLHHPNKAFLNRTRLPLIERDPVHFWKVVSLVLLVLVVVLLGMLTNGAGR
ncbi:protein kinase domain-containing protein [Noviherbaspirillum sp. ST9]|uniref:protein kinase domain-containing protein n=1 Tax=Noviherbaspirillum sp. ST9 TaxID=3401606 RepID=UPI003B588E9F